MIIRKLNTNDNVHIHIKVIDNQNDFRNNYQNHNKRLNGVLIAQPVSYMLSITKYSD